MYVHCSDLERVLLPFLDDGGASDRRNSVATLSSSLSSVQLAEEGSRTAANLPHAFWVSLHASIKSASAWLNPRTGSLMVSTLCQVLQDKWRDKDVLECFVLAHQMIPDSARREGLSQNPELSMSWPTCKVYLSDEYPL